MSYRYHDSRFFDQQTADFTLHLRQELEKVFADAGSADELQLFEDVLEYIIAREFLNQDAANGDL